MVTGACALGRPDSSSDPRARRPAPTHNVLRRGVRAAARATRGSCCAAAPVRPSAALPKNRLEAAMTVTVAILGFPRIGPRRELKTALESHWAGKSDAAALLATAAELRAKAWARQR